MNEHCENNEVIRLKLNYILGDVAYLQLSVRCTKERVILDDFPLSIGQTLIFSDNQEKNATPVGTLSTVPIEFDKDWGNNHDR